MLVPPRWRGKTSDGAAALETTKRHVDLEELLRPIPGSDPSGPSLRYDEVYDVIKEARRSDDPSLPRDIWSRDLKSADWVAVAEACEEALTRHSKDLQIGAWLLEAWVHLEAYGGLERGVELLLRMSGNYWKAVHPSIEEGAEFRASPFVWMNEKLRGSLGYLPIASPAASPERRVLWGDWKRALWFDKLKARRPGDEEVAEEVASSITTREIRDRTVETSEFFYRENAQALEDAIAGTRALEAFLDDQLGEDSPSLVRFRDELNEILAWTEGVLQEGAFRPAGREDSEMAKDDKGSVTAEETAHNGQGTPMAAPAGRAIASRAEAYRMLLDAASYLREIEPHSPTPFLVMKAVSWGEKSLDDLLRQFVREGLNLETLFTVLGIEPPDER